MTSRPRPRPCVSDSTDLSQVLLVTFVVSSFDFLVLQLAMSAAIMRSCVVVLIQVAD